MNACFEGSSACRLERNGQFHFSALSFSNADIDHQSLQPCTRAQTDDRQLLLGQLLEQSQLASASSKLLEYLCGDSRKLTTAFGRTDSTHQCLLQECILSLIPKQLALSCIGQQQQ